jgi:hypothetical protein
MKNTSKLRAVPLPGELEMLDEKFVERATAICEQHGSIPESDFDVWLAGDDEFRWKKSA